MITNSESEELVCVSSVDYDGCYAYRSKSSKDAYLKQKLMDHIARRSKKRAIIFSGSLRQDPLTDHYNAGKNGNGYFCHQLLKIVSRLKALNPAVDFSADRFLTADLYSEMPDGASFAMSRLVAATAVRNSSPFFSFDYLANRILESNIIGNVPYAHSDVEKLDILYAQIHRMAAKYPTRKIQFDFYDDQDQRILGPLSEIFSENPQLLPLNVELHLFHYHCPHWMNEPEEPRPYGQPIQGSGEIDFGYKHTLRAMYRHVKAAKMSTIQTPFPLGQALRNQQNVTQLLEFQKTAPYKPKSISSPHFKSHSRIPFNHSETIIGRICTNGPQLYPNFSSTNLLAKPTANRSNDEYLLLNRFAYQLSICYWYLGQKSKQKKSDANLLRAHSAVLNAVNDMLNFCQLPEVKREKVKLNFEQAVQAHLDTLRACQVGFRVIDTVKHLKSYDELQLVFSLFSASGSQLMHLTSKHSLSNGLSTWLGDNNPDNQYLRAINQNLLILKEKTDAKKNRKLSAAAKHLVEALNSRCIKHYSKSKSERENGLVQFKADCVGIIEKARPKFSAYLDLRIILLNLLQALTGVGLVLGLNGLFHGRSFGIRPVYNSDTEDALSTIVKTLSPA